VLENSRVLFLDFQTTGAKPGKGEILEIAWSTSESDSHSRIVRPETSVVSAFIQNLTGINDSLLCNAVSLKEVIEEWQIFLNAYSPQAIVIHYAKFEQAFLDDLLLRFNFKFSCPVLCTHEIAKRIYPNLPTRGVAGLAGYFGCSMNEKKRAADQVAATKVIWNGLQKDLAELGIKDLNSLKEGLKNLKPEKKKKTEYPLEKSKRLNLPVNPGLYRMIGKNGEVLYVGKATCLRDRVNSYFRGQKSRNSFKLQMLTQVWDLDVTICDSALEAALLECDEIKKWSPRYNVALKTGQRELTFYNRDFTSAASVIDGQHMLGPISSRNALLPLLRLNEVFKFTSETPDIPEDLLFEKIDKQVLLEGFKIFCECYAVSHKDLQSVRGMLALGMRWYREYLKTEALTGGDAGEGEEALVSEDEPDSTGKDLAEYTPEEVSEKFFRLFRHSAAVIRRCKKLQRLLNCEFDITDDAGKRLKSLKVQNGLICKSDEKVSNTAMWDISTYDRLSVLSSEAKRLGIEIRSSRSLLK